MSDVTKLQSAEPVLITDGTIFADVMTSDPTGNEAGLVVRDVNNGVVIFGDTSTYAAATVYANLSLSVNSTMSLAYLWHPSSLNKTYNLQKVVVNTDSGGGSTRMAVRLTRITAENNTPGGSTLVPLALNSASPASGATVRISANAPTRAATDICTSTFIGNTTSSVIFDFPIDVSGPVCRAGVAEGWELRLEIATPLLSGLRMGVQFLWTEA
jgi:hypothetical protein